MFFVFNLYGGHRALHVLTHFFPTRRSSDLACCTVNVPARVCTEASPIWVNTNCCMRGERPSGGVLMLALLVPEKSWASALSGSLSKPPRPKLLFCALPAASSKPTS